MRTKTSVGALTPWSNSKRIFPKRGITRPGLSPFGRTPATVPEPAPLREWPFKELVQHDLQRFYSGNLTVNGTRVVPTHIPDEVRERPCCIHLRCGLGLGFRLYILRLPVDLPGVSKYRYVGLSRRYRHCDVVPPGVDRVGGQPRQKDSLTVCRCSCCRTSGRG